MKGGKLGKDRAWTACLIKEETKYAELGGDGHFFEDSVLWGQEEANTHGRRLGIVSFYDPEIQNGAKWMEARLQLAHGKNLPFNRAVHPKLGSGLRRERVLFLEKFKQNRCPLMLLPVLCLCEATGEPADGSPSQLPALVRR